MSGFIHLRAQGGPELRIARDSIKVCEGEIALVEIEITGVPEVWVIYEFEGVSSGLIPSSSSPIRLRLTEPGMYIITDYGDANSPGSQPPDTFYVVPYPAPDVVFTGGGINCSDGVLDTLVVHFSGDPGFVLYHYFNGVYDSLVTSQPERAFLTDQSFIIQTVSLKDQNCQRDIEKYASYIYIDVPAPVILGSTEVCQTEEAIYRAEESDYMVEWNIPDGVDYEEGSDDEGYYIHADWSDPGDHPIFLRYTEYDHGCKTDWGDLLVKVYPKPAVYDLDTSICFELEESIEIHIASEEGDQFDWPEIDPDGPIVYIDQYGNYEYIVTNIYSCVDTGRVELISDCNPAFYVPEAFTPNNGDNLNDKLVFFGLFKKLDFNIYSPSGVLLFHTTENSTEYWDGTYKGNDVPPGSYHWSAVYLQEEGKPMEKTGIVTIIR